MTEEQAQAILTKDMEMSSGKSKKERRKGLHEGMGRILPAGMTVSHRGASLLATARSSRVMP